ncbi:hypothetical protein [Novosphingobium cyanobacteriorum]|uniref:Anti-sigma factor n=1 Tax=Novosphingobium cyanobacteriorum TaxID=3024215 RepID=A0ABT6CCU7_9SPHN|nr:hypothetical protein [Novosphingobium cyanobacteriorum]MDF8331750.1 hypothetical protein [Novosphingobium cyanobacteriorum]
MNANDDRKDAEQGLEGVDDARLSAWIDGMLDEQGDEAMRELIAGNAVAAARADRLRHMDALVRQAVPQEDELPAGLLARLGLADAPAQESSNVVSLASARDARVAKPVAAPANRLWRIAAQVALVGGVGLTLATFAVPHGPKPDEADYRALSNASRSAPADVNALVVFAPGTDEARARALSGKVGARLVGAPNDAGAWKLAIDPARRDAVLAGLRADPQVTMAEPVDQPAAGTRP